MQGGGEEAQGLHLGGREMMRGQHSGCSPQRSEGAATGEEGKRGAAFLELREEGISRSAG